MPLNLRRLKSSRAGFFLFYFFFNFIFFLCLRGSGVRAWGLLTWLAGKGTGTHSPLHYHSGGEHTQWCSLRLGGLPWGVWGWWGWQAEGRARTLLLSVPLECGAGGGASCCTHQHLDPGERSSWPFSRCSRDGCFIFWLSFSTATFFVEPQGRQISSGS